MTQFTNKDVFCSDDDFATMQELAVQKTPQEAQEDVAELDNQIAEVLAAEDFGDEHRVAIVIYLQARNYFARLAGVEQTGLPDGFNRGLVPEVALPDPLASKHVAVFGPLKACETLVQILVQPPWPADARMKAYATMRELLVAIEANEVVGVLALHGKKGSIIDSLRHDFKNLPGKSRQDAEVFMFPPCIDVVQTTSLVEMAAAIRRLGTGGVIPEVFDLAASLPSLMVHTVVPKQSVHIVIIDDEQKFIDTMQCVLRSWRNVTVEGILHEEGLPAIPTQADIVLLDEDLGTTVKGSDVHRSWLENGFSGLVASTTGGKKPQYAQHHFGQKASMANSHESAMEFVHFMNRLLATL